MYACISIMYVPAPRPIRTQTPVFQSTTKTYTHIYIYKTPPTPSQTRLPLALKRQRQNQQSRCDEQRSTDVYRGAGFQVREHGDDGRHDAEDAVGGRGDCVARAAVFGGEDFGGVGVDLMGVSMRKVIGG